jgi:DNA-binding NtrC family response regulator
MASVILVVDDQESIRHFVSNALTDSGYEVWSAENGRSALERLAEGPPDLILLDLKLGDLDGLEVLRRAKEMYKELPVIIMTAHADVESAVEAMKGGAYDFVTKPLHLDQLRVLVERGLESQKLIRELELLRRKDRARLALDFVRGTSPAIQRVYQIAEQVAQSESTSVLIEGESGTGKQLVASIIHDKSTRREKPFLEINCAAIPKDLLESELFGHEKGAFTDARQMKQGLLELANGGTLFLDEIGEMSLPLQVKLLKVLENMSFRRVGGTKDIKVSVRIISATNQDLDQMVKDGLFREDLYYRLKVVPIHMPALRERREDIVPLAMHFLRHFSRAFHKNFERLSPEAERMLVSYPWPGNIRELKNVFERTVLLEEGPVVLPVHLERAFAPSRRESGHGEQVVDKLEQALAAPSIPEGGIQFEDLVEGVERALIMKASEATGWNQSRTAQVLNLKRDKLRYRMKIYSIRHQRGGHGPGATDFDGTTDEDATDIS